MAQFIQFELNGVKEALELYSSKRVKQAIRSTLDKTGTFAKREIVDGITKEYNISGKDVRQKIEVIRTKPNIFETTLKIVSRKLSLMHFGARQAPKGIIVNIKRSHVTFIPEAWLGPVNFPRYAAIRRIRPWPTGIGRGGKGKRQGIDPERRSKLKMKGLPGPSIPDMAKPIMEKIKHKVSEFIQTTFNSEIRKRVGY